LRNFDIDVTFIVLIIVFLSVLNVKRFWRATVDAIVTKVQLSLRTSLSVNYGAQSN
jgi:hypothetical protein